MDSEPAPQAADPRQQFPQPIMSGGPHLGLEKLIKISEEKYRVNGGLGWRSPLMAVQSQWACYEINTNCDRLWAIPNLH